MNFIIRGDIAYSIDKDTIITKKNHYLVVQNGLIQAISETKPELNYKFYDYSGKLIIPGMIDLHVHAPQYSFRGLWMDMELLDWLNFHTFPEEAKYKNLDYANQAYDIFVNDIKNSATTRAVIFSTIHKDASLLLMDKLEKSGLKTYVGKVNMDRNSPDILRETDYKASISDTKLWLEKCHDYNNTKPIITPRFIPSCTDELMRELGNLVIENKIALQSHLSENKGEIEWVKELCPWSKNYSDAYDKFGTFGKYSKTIMAHCVWCDDDEVKLIKNRGVFIAHCPTSNSNLASGIAPIKKYLNNNMRVGLGSDVAGGTDKSIIKLVPFTIQMSKLYWRLVDQDIPPITFEEAFYMATKGGGEFFGNVGSFEKGFEADILILDEDNLPTTMNNLEIIERLERFFYLTDDRDVLHKFVSGKQIF